VHYSVPVVIDWPGTVIAINVGGALIPTLMSLYLLAKNGLWGLGLLATACVAAVCYSLAQPVPGVGIALPTFVPAVTAAIAAWLLSRRYAAPLAYIGRSMGALIGADLLNLGAIQGPLCSLRTRRRSSALRPLMSRSMSNSGAMRLTASSAIGEIAAAFFPRRALAAISASSKNCRLACAQCWAQGRHGRLQLPRMHRLSSWRRRLRRSRSN
jgi:hypothetical protein